jgi:hypothetical protein
MGLGCSDCVGHGESQATAVRSLVASLGYCGYKAFDCRGDDDDDDDDDDVLRIFVKVRLSDFRQRRPSHSR